MLAVSPASGPEFAPASREGVGLGDVGCYRYRINGLGDRDRERAPLPTGAVGTASAAAAHRKTLSPPLSIEPGQRLSYAAFPAYLGERAPGGGYAATAIGLDLEFDDGSWLSDFPVTDQADYGIDPYQQYSSCALTVDQWNARSIALDAVVGKRVVGVWVAAAGVPPARQDAVAPLRGGWLDRVLGAARRLVDAVLRPGAARLSSRRREIHGWISDVRIEPRRPANAAGRFTVDLVDTRRGTHSSSNASRGNTIPAVAVPNGFNFAIPVTDASSVTWPYRYHDGNNSDNTTSMQAFAISHSPSPWIGDRGIVQVMPIPDSTAAADRTSRSAPFLHSNETARPHHYSVRLDNGIVAELAATDHVVVMRFRLPDGAGIVFDQPDNRGGLHIEPLSDEAHISGFTDSHNSAMPSNAPRMFFAAAVDRPFRVVRSAAIGERPAVSAVIAFDTTRGLDPQSPAVSDGAEWVTIRIATSFIGVDQATRSLHAEAPPSVSFDDVVTAGRNSWQSALDRVRIEDNNHDRLVSFTSSLYRLFLYPNSASENAGTAAQPHWVYADTSIPPVADHTETATGCRIRDGFSAVNNGFWDTYRTAWPAYSLLAPDLSARLIDGFVEHYRASGWQERWSAPGPVNSMVGTSSDIVIADAVASGVRLDDLEAAYDSALRNATTVSARSEVGRADNGRSIFRGYVSTSTAEGLSWTLEGAINDFGIARLSRYLADTGTADNRRRAEFEANARYFESRARGYQNVFHPELKFFVGRRDDGGFRAGATDFEPRLWGGDYTETNAWGMAFTVPHDGAGLAELYGGRAGLEVKLDEFFATGESATAEFAGSYGRVIHEMTEARDIRLGSFGLSNQPAHHIPYLYAFTGAPHKTQAIVRESIRRCFLGSEIGQGYPGDEDNGEMSAWYVFGALGLYPLTPGSGELVITSPSVSRSTITFPDGARTSIAATGLSADNVYIQSVVVDGRPWRHLAIPIAVLRRGVSIDIVLGPEPSGWGAEPECEPYSLRRNGVEPAVEFDRTTPTAALTRATAGSTSAAATAEWDTPGSGAVFFDDSSTGGRTLRNGDWVAFDFLDRATPAEIPAITMYTVTLGDPCEGAAWVLEAWVPEAGAADSAWIAVDSRSSVSFPWPTQTRAFVLLNATRSRRLRLRVVGSSDLDVRQLEFLG